MDDGAPYDGPTADVVAAAIVAACREVDEPYTHEPYTLLTRAARMLTGITVCPARHYALWALAKAYTPRERSKDKVLLAKLVGVPGDPSSYWANSHYMVFRSRVPPDPHRPRAAKWWREDAFGRVVAAVLAAKGHSPEPQALDAPQPLETGPVSPAGDSVPEAVPEAHAAAAEQMDDFSQESAKVVHSPEKANDAKPVHVDEMEESGHSTRRERNVATPAQVDRVRAFAETVARAVATPRPRHATAEEQGLARRGAERRKLADILAEAAANTAKLPVRE